MKTILRWGASAAFTFFLFLTLFVLSFQTKLRSETYWISALESSNMYAFLASSIDRSLSDSAPPGTVPSESELEGIMQSLLEENVTRLLSYINGQRPIFTFYLPIASWGVNPQALANSPFSRWSENTEVTDALGALMDPASVRQAEEIIATLPGYFQWGWVVSLVFAVVTLAILSLVYMLSDSNKFHTLSWTLAGSGLLAILVAWIVRTSVAGFIQNPQLNLSVEIGAFLTTLISGFFDLGDTVGKIFFGIGILGIILTRQKQTTVAVAKPPSNTKKLLLVIGVFLVISTLLGAGMLLKTIGTRKVQPSQSTPTDGLVLYKGDAWQIAHPAGWIVNEVKKEEERVREITVVHPDGIARLLIVARFEPSLREPNAMEEAIRVRKEFLESDSDLVILDFKKRVDGKIGGYMMDGTLSSQGKMSYAHEQGLLDIYGKFLMFQVEIADEYKDQYKSVVEQMINSFDVE